MSDNETFEPEETVVPAVQAQAVDTPLAQQGIIESPIVLPPNFTTLAFAVQPSATPVDERLAPAVQVRATNSTGSPAPGQTVTLSLLNPNGALLGGTTTAMTNSFGVASFADLTVSAPGSFSLRASAGTGDGIEPVDSAPFSVTGFAGPACTAPGLTERTLASLGQPSAIAIGDFNHDGLNDIAAATPVEVAIFLQSTGGSYALAASQPSSGSGSTPSKIVAVDINADSHLDVVVTQPATASVVSMLGNGAGGLTSGVSAGVLAVPVDLAVADLNNDGYLDAVMATNSPDGVAILPGNGSGSFGAATQLPAGTTPRALVVGDFNDDGRIDIAVPNQASGDVSIMRANVGSGFTTTAVAVPGTPVALARGDLNEDGSEDLVVLDPGGNFVHVLAGNGSGQFSLGTPVQIGLNRFAITTGDFNDDGHLDVVTLGDTTLSILVGAGDATLTLAEAHSFSAEPLALARGDLDGDGRPEIVVGTADDAIVELARTCAAPPTITPVIAGTAGGGGWYRSTVNVSWIVTAPGGIAGSEGCGPVTLTEETTGTTLTCSATSNSGGFAEASVTIRIDLTAPGITGPIVTPSPNAAGWNNSVPVNVVYGGNDVGNVQSGGVTCTSLTFNEDTNGTLVTGSCSDLAGNAAAGTPVTVRIDRVAPNVLFGP
ncbi:MAG TPA: VCBS repeat-containing protein, partial [Ilumatobacteraceae bacterium]